MKIILRAMLISTILTAHASYALAQESLPSLPLPPEPSKPSEASTPLTVPNASPNAQIPIAPMPPIPNSAPAPAPAASATTPPSPITAGDLPPLPAAGTTKPVLPVANNNPPSVASAPSLPGLPSLPLSGNADNKQTAGGNAPQLPSSLAPAAPSGIMGTNTPMPSTSPAADNGMKELKLPGEASNSLQPLPLPTPSSPEKPELAPGGQLMPLAPSPPANVKGTAEVAAVNPDTGKDKDEAQKAGKHKKKKGGHAKAKKEDKTPAFYVAIRDRQPEEIYKKKYDKFNRHLPVAYYEKDYDTLVFVATQNDDINGLRSLLNTGRSVNMRDKDGDTPLLVAVKYDAINTAHLLLQHHADMDAKDHNGMTAMQAAERDGNFRMVGLLKGIPVSE